MSTQKYTVEEETQLAQMCKLDFESPSQHRRLASIVATVSKSSRKVEIMQQMIMAGANVMRLNFSHESHEAHAESIALVQEALDNIYQEKEYAPVVSIALDTKGPEIRTGLLESREEVELRKYDNLRLSINKDLYDKGNKETIYVDYPNIINVTSPGDRVFINDGAIFLIVKEVGVDGIICEVVQGGMLGAHKNVKLPEVDIDLPSVSEKDVYDLQFGLQKKVDFIFASSVRNATAVREIRSMLGEKGKDIKIIAKIESKWSLARLDEIAEAADGILFARADVGTEIPLEKVFMAQKAVIAHCNRIGKPVIVASQLLESMRLVPRPSRAEVSDLGNAVIDGSDAVLLSSETAIGKYPVEAVQYCNIICREAEQALWYRNLFEDLLQRNPVAIDAAHSLAIAAVDAAKKTMAALIVVLTVSGRSAQLLSRYRPRCPIMGVSRCPRSARHQNLYRGIIPVVYPDTPVDDWITECDLRVKYAVTLARKMDLIEVGDAVVIVSPWREGGGIANNLRIIYAFFEQDRIDCMLADDVKKAQKNSKLFVSEKKTTRNS